MMIEEAAHRIEPHVSRTPLLESAPLSERHGAQVAIKCEHLQRTGSFKVRGSANVVHSLEAAAAAPRHRRRAGHDGKGTPRRRTHT